VDPFGSGSSQVRRHIMKTLIVYDSIYGNTQAIAQAIGDALPGEVTIVHVTEANVLELKDLELLIIGSPTHGSLPSEAIQGLIEKIGAPAREDAKVATFDTRLTWGFLRRWGFAASKIADTLQEKGWTLVGTPGGFFVRGLKKGPLKRGEEDRAAAWAKGLVENPT
jgi:flavodoxin I